MRYPIGDIRRPFRSAGAFIIDDGLSNTASQNMRFSQVFACVLPAALLIGSASAQKLPPPSNTVFKCEAEGRIAYSDTPCLGAEKLEMEPSDTKAFDPAAHRTKLTPPLQRECQRLDVEVPRAEAEERRAARLAMPEVQRRLFDLRKRFRELGC